MASLSEIIGGSLRESFVRHVYMTHSDEDPHGFADAVLAHSAKLVGCSVCAGFKAMTDSIERVDKDTEGES